MNLKEKIWNLKLENKKNMKQKWMPIWVYFTLKDFEVHRFKTSISNQMFELVIIMPKYLILNHSMNFETNQQIVYHYLITLWLRRDILDNYKVTRKESIEWDKEEVDSIIMCNVNRTQNMFVLYIIWHYWLRSRNSKQKLAVFSQSCAQFSCK